MRLSGAAIVIECLKEQQVDTVFGFPGNAIIEIYDELWKNRKSIHHVLVSHEQGAVFAADGYARASGKVGVCMATSGPGATNLVTGIASAYMDSIPLVAITANVSIDTLGKDSFQEVDIAGITMPVTKQNFIVKDIRVLAYTLRKAFRLAKSGRPGPVLVDIPRNVTREKTEFAPVKPEKPLPLREKYTEADLDQAAEILMNAKRPFLLAGGGLVSSDAYREFRRLMKTLDAPAANTLMGKGVISAADPLYAGMAGFYGTQAALEAFSSCDVLFAAGTRFADRLTGHSPKRFAEQAKIIHLDIDPAEINKNVPCGLALIGDAKEILKQLNKRLAPRTHPEWKEQILGSGKAKEPVDDSFLSSSYLISRLAEVTKGTDLLVTTDVGQHQMWAAKCFPSTKPRTFFTSGGLGAMGYGLGAAVGASIARPECRVVNITGDGCFRMNLSELATACREKLPLVQIIMDNHALGLVRQLQESHYRGRYSATLIEDQTDYCRIAEGFGAKAFRITSKDETDDVLRQAFSENGPVVIDCVIEREENVEPTIQPDPVLRRNRK